MCVLCVSVCVVCCVCVRGRVYGSVRAYVPEAVYPYGEIGSATSTSVIFREGKVTVLSSAYRSAVFPFSYARPSYPLSCCNVLCVTNAPACASCQGARTTTCLGAYARVRACKMMIQCTNIRDVLCVFYEYAVCMYAIMGYAVIGCVVCALYAVLFYPCGMLRR